MLCPVATTKRPCPGARCRRPLLAPPVTRCCSSPGGPPLRDRRDGGTGAQRCDTVRRPRRDRLDRRTVRRRQDHRTVGDGAAAHAGQRDGPDRRAGRRNLSERERATLRLLRLGYLFQDYNLLQSLTSVENVAVPLRYAGVRRPTPWRGRANCSIPWAWPTRRGIVPRTVRWRKQRGDGTRVGDGP